MSEDVLSGKSRLVGAASNPFATRFVSPGCIPYFFSSPEETDQILDRGEASFWRGQILGPHGSGKTTLVRHLQPLLKDKFDSIKHLIIRGRSSVQLCHEPSGVISAVKSTTAKHWSRQLIVIDGVERLSWLQRRLLISHCQRRGNGLIVTTHRRLAWLPVLYRTNFDEQQFNRILNHLGVDRRDHRYQQLADRHGGNCRDMLFELYDQASK